MRALGIGAAICFFILGLGCQMNLPAMRECIVPTMGPTDGPADQGTNAAENYDRADGCPRVLVCVGLGTQQRPQPEPDGSADRSVASVPVIYPPWLIARARWPRCDRRCHR